MTNSQTTPEEITEDEANLERVVFGAQACLIDKDGNTKHIRLRDALEIERKSKCKTINQQ